MLAISFSFPAKRFHATPWGRQVNEGAVEWPPSPWRILRSLVAVWHHKFPDVTEPEIRDLINQLLEPPRFHLPRVVSEGHTRHYMPLVNGDRTKIFDTFIAVKPEDAVIAVWADVSLSSAQRDLLAKLLEAMSYFGRAESWVIASLCDNISAERLNSFPLELGVAPEDGLKLEVASAGEHELVRTLVTTLQSDHAAWYEQTRQEQRQDKMKELRTGAAKGKSADKVKLTKKDEDAIDGGLPATLFDALHADTSELRKAGWNQPPGSRWINYTRRSDALSATAARSVVVRERKPIPTVARYAVCSTVRPSLTNAVVIGDLARECLMSKSNKVRGNPAPMFSGKNDDGERLNDHHRHAHFLAEAPADDGRISHLNVFAMHEFSADEEQALRDFTVIKDHRHGYDLQCVLLGIGRPEDFGGINERAGRSLALAESKTWISRTPFVLTRHLKLKRSDMADPQRRDAALKAALIDVVRFELSQREQFAGLFTDVQIEPILDPKHSGTMLNGHFTSWLKFRRERLKGGGHHSSQHGYGFKLTFAEKVKGPIALGYGSHFGLGQFVPAD